jgi:cell division septum initiation protein DivIVA
VAKNEPPRAGRGDADLPFGIPRASEGLADVRDPLPPEVRDPSFAVSVRGYDRRAVDRYVEQVNRLIAELQVGGSPRAAVRHALDRVGEQTSSILQRARETAEEITSGAREEADETTGRARAEAGDVLGEARRGAAEATSRAKAEADQIVAGAQATAEEMLARAKDESESTVAGARVEAEGRVRRAEEEIASLREQAEAQMRSLQADISAVSDERRALMEEVRGIAARLAEMVAEEEPSDTELSPQSPATAEDGATAETPPAGPDERPNATGRASQD